MVKHDGSDPNCCSRCADYYQNQQPDTKSESIHEYTDSYANTAPV